VLGTASRPEKIAASDWSAVRRKDMAHERAGRRTPTNVLPQGRSSRDVCRRSCSLTRQADEARAIIVILLRRPVRRHQDYSMTWSGNGLVMTALQWYACDDWGSGGARTAIKNRALRCRYQAGWHLARSSVAHRRIVLRNEDKKRSGGRPCFTAPSAATRVQPGNIRRDISVAGVVSIVAWPTSPSHDRPSIERQLSAALSSDRRGVGGEGDHWPAMEQPDQADGVEAEEAAVGRVGPLRQGRQASRSSTLHPNASAWSPQRARNRRPSSTACCQSTTLTWSGQRRSRVEKAAAMGDGDLATRFSSPLTP
jgi:hypothetical protein